ncbi:MAG: DUF3014 domain-containing protein [Abyssibacter sp.]|uniref:DUF3014 domain-containing protein n=1 Tax=Abyssibacter sp. TaxID=2320200 RepID=UPI00321B8EBB
MKRGAWIAIGVAALVLVAVGVLSLFGTKLSKGEPVAEAPVAEAEAPTPTKPQYPIEPSAPEPASLESSETPADEQAPEPEQPPLPSLADSDAPLRSELAQTTGPSAVERFLVPDALIRKAVVTVDNLDSDPVSRRFRPVTQVQGTVPVIRSGDSIRLDSANYARYEPWVQAFTTASPEQLVAVYTRYYPLFQDAYEDLGYPDGYFNDRLVQIIDHLLATPEVTGPIALKQPKVFFEFADPKLERLSWGQKALIRIGPEQARAVKQQLRSVRDTLLAQSGGQ